MEIKFSNMEIPCLIPVVKKNQSFEETQELRLSEDMPDIGRIIGSWGQVLIRGKEWKTGQLGTSGGVTVWVMYMPEDGGEPVCMETWVPFQAKWNFNDTGSEGKIRVLSFLRSVDARSTSARKMLIRVSLCVCCEGWIQEQFCVPISEKTPENVYLLRKQYPVMLHAESGEKEFFINEELSLSANCPPINRIVHYELHTAFAEQKVVSDKAVFRGAAILRILYSAADGQLYNCDFDIPFSQLTELDKEYTESSQVNFWFAITNLELEKIDNGNIRLQCGVVGQYVILDRVLLDLVEDAYCKNRKEELYFSTVQLPAILDYTNEFLSFDAFAEVECRRIADVSWSVNEIDTSREGNEAKFQLRGMARILYYNSDGQLQNCTVNLEGKCDCKADQNIDVFAVAVPTGKIKVSAVQNGLQVHGEAKMETQFASGFIHNVVEGISFEDATEHKKAGPSIILLRPNGENLWDIAKKTRSSMDEIMVANHISDEPENNNMLLIPVRH